MSARVVAGAAASLRHVLAARGDDRRCARERGTTMIELVVAMVLISICGAIATASIISLSRTSNQTQAITDATSQNNRAFQLLDRTVRWASAVSTPGQGTGSPSRWYVELRDTTDGTSVCTQLRIDPSSQQLQSRTWREGTTPTTTWTPVANGVTNGTATSGSATQPFRLPGLTGSAGRQQLAFYLVSTSGPANQRASSTSSFTLTAVNSAATTTTGSICQDGGRP